MGTASRRSFQLSRRGFLAGTAAFAGATVIAGCGGDDDSGKAASTTPQGSNGAGGELSVFTFFDPQTLVIDTEARLPFGLGNPDGPLPADKVPPEVQVIVSLEGEEVTTETVALRSEGLPRGYYPLRFVPPAAGIYDLKISGEGIADIGSATQVTDNPVRIPGPGDPFPNIDTPTIADPRGVTPICTRSPICPLHEVNLPDLLTDGSPSVVMVSTPAFCFTDICGPVLDLLLDEADTREGMSMLHAEVYADPDNENPPITTSPIVQELGLTYEPTVFMLNADGTISDRLDFVFDGSELSEAIDRLTA